MAALFIGSYCVLVWPNWRDNPDLSHGFFAPLTFALLLWESGRIGPLRWLPAGWPWLWATGLASGGAVVLFAFAGVLAASVEWSHSAVVFVLAGSLGLFLLATLLMLAGERVRALPFNWVSLTAIGLWLLSAPLPPGTYARLMLELQTMVTHFVLNALHLAGIPARQQGNIIQLATTSVGIEDACSGIRSLLSCVYAGFFFSAWLVRRPTGRMVLIIVAPLLAVGMNFFRSLILTLLVNAGVRIEGFWHDTTGYAILAFTSLGLAGLALLLGSSVAPLPPPSGVRSPATATSRWQPRLVLAGMVVVVALGVFFLWHGQPAAVRPGQAPDLYAFLPRAAPGWLVQTPTDLPRAASVLKTKHLAERSYLRREGEENVLLTVYVAYWAPGQTPVSQVAAHTPDACWPGAGWTSLSQPEMQQRLMLGTRPLPVAEHRLFRNAGSVREHVWFWHVYDGRVINYRDPYSVPALLEIALRYGFRRQGSQYFIRVSSNQPWEKLAPEPIVREIFANLQTAGL